MTLPENTQDVIPPTERNQDPERSMHDLLNESARPLTDEERKAADRDNPAAGQTVYAPASERVPKTVTDYGDVVEHTDTATPERQAIGQAPTTPTGMPGGQTNSPGSAWPASSEPSFTRVPRPSDTDATGSTNGEYSSDLNSQPNRWMSSMSAGSMVPFGMGWLGLSMCAGIGVWLWMRWRRERNKPINRLRRQAREAARQARSRAYALRDQMPDMPELPDEATRPAVGLGTALLSIGVLLWQQSQRSRSRVDAARAETRSRSKDMSKEMKGRAEKASKKATKMGRRASERVSERVADVDWQERLIQLRELWNPSRIELEKVSSPKR